MKTVLKQTIYPNSEAQDFHEIVVAGKPDSYPLCVMMQGTEACVWFEGDIEEEDENFSIFCVGTGHGAVPDKCDYMNSIIDANGFVWHFYKPWPSRSMSTPPKKSEKSEEKSSKKPAAKKAPAKAKGIARHYR